MTFSPTEHFLMTLLNLFFACENRDARSAILSCWLSFWVPEKSP